MLNKHLHSKCPGFNPKVCIFGICFIIKLTTKEEKLPVSIVEGAQTEANKDGCSTKECCCNNTENRIIYLNTDESSLNSYRIYMKSLKQTMHSYLNIDSMNLVFRCKPLIYRAQKYGTSIADNEEMTSWHCVDSTYFLLAIQWLVSNLTKVIKISLLQVAFLKTHTNESVSISTLVLMFQ